MPRETGTIPCMHCYNVLSNTQDKCTDCFAGAQAQCYLTDCNKHPRIKHVPVTTIPTTMTRIKVQDIKYILRFSQGLSQPKRLIIRAEHKW